jgi:branched-chain amino acid transport system permease protein
MRIVAFCLALVAIIGWPFLIRDAFYLHMGVMVALNIVLALSMNLMLRIDQLSLAHGALMGLGAYASALLVMRIGLPFPVAFVASGAVCALVAFIVGPTMLQIRGVYFVLLTFAFGEVIVLMFVEWVDVFGGNNGIRGIPKPAIFDYRLTDRLSLYLFAVFLAVATFLTVREIYRSELGSVITSLGENESLAVAIGVDAPGYRLAVFCMSSAIVGWGGAFYAHYLSFISPEAFGFWTPVNMVVINVVGGIGSPWGAVLGALVLVPLPEFLRDAKQYQVLAYGVLLMTFLLFLPEGLVGIGRRFRRRPARRGTSS